MVKKEKNGLIYFQFKQFLQEEGIKHFISTKIEKGRNDFNLSLYKRTNITEIIKRRQRLADSVGILFESFVFQQQIHGNNVKIITKKHRAKGNFKYSDAIANNDAMITNEANICLNVLAGDCVPILFFDPSEKVIAVAHAGWRGTYKQIAQKTIEKMSRQFGCLPSDIKAGIGPSISQRNYEVNHEVYLEFEEKNDNLPQFFKTGNKKGKYYLDLWEANKQQLIAVGLKEENIELSNICTFDQNDLFFSARRADEGRFMGGIMLIGD